MKTKLFFILAFVLAASLQSSAQVTFVPNSAHRFSVGVGGGLARLYGDLPNRKMTPVGRLNIEYKIEEYLSAGIEGQIGTLESGVVNAQPDSRGRYGRNVSWGLHSVNNYQAAHAYGRIGVGYFTEDNDDLSLYIKNIYGGIGVGVVRNSIKDIVKSFPEKREAVQTIKMKSMGVVVPLNLGINVDIPNTNLTGNFNIQYNITTSEGLDGYDFGSQSLKKDGYLFISLGIKYNFGPLL